MAGRGYGEPVGNEFGADSDRDRWRDRDREHSEYRSSGFGGRDRDEDRGFFERAGEEIRSWFGDRDEDDRRFGRESERGWSGGPPSERDRDRERQRGFGPGRGGSDHMRESRSSFGGMAQSGYGRPGGGFEREPERGYGPSRGGGGRDERSSMASYGEGRGPFGRGERSFEGRGDWNRERSESGRHPQSWGEANRGGTEPSEGFGDFRGTLGGFGNQRFGSSQDELYRSWRDKQIEQLDRDYEEYCRDCEQKFQQDFDSWRRTRQSQPQGQGQSQAQGQGQSQPQAQSGAGASDELILGNQSGSSSSSAPSTRSQSGGSPTADTSGSTETAGSSGGGRSGSRSRS